MNLVSGIGDRLRAALAALLALVALVACTPDEGEEPPPEPAVDVSGEFGSVPVVSFDAPLPLEDSSVETLIEGDGRELAANEPVLLSLTAYDGDTGELMEGREVGVARTFTLTPEDVGEDLFPVLTGSREGSRLLLQQPVEDNGEEHMLVLVVDVRYTQARGEEVEPPDRENLPTVSLDEEGSPSIDVPDADPPNELTVQPLIRGDGPQVQPGQEVTLQYSGVQWESGEPYDSTWEGGKVPQTVVLDETFEGLRTGLVDQPVGSQVLLVIPPAQAHGTDTLVLVVDILATTGGDADSLVTTTDPEETEEPSGEPTEDSQSGRGEDASPRGGD
ncbi:FKBP-type peptidyl-prolyl cis-trans isomerase [Georgenia deserti]|uniref:peptidylprolyl isomerase n=1 Tax=Georgenia deserti TaxID=2093781 RepID=A0ABW4L7K0_9MICO